MNYPSPSGLFEGLELTGDLLDLKKLKSEILAGSSWYDPLLGCTRQLPVEIYVANDEYTSYNFLLEKNPRCKFLVCEDSAGADLLFHGKFQNGKVITCM